jgi:hypothetical protein
MPMMSFRAGIGARHTAEKKLRHERKHGRFDDAEHSFVA